MTLHCMRDKQSEVTKNYLPPTKPLFPTKQVREVAVTT